MPLAECAGAWLDAPGNLKLEFGAFITGVEAGYFAMNIYQPGQVELDEVVGLRAIGKVNSGSIFETQHHRNLLITPIDFWA